ncbi:hypothetical protein LTR27_012360 [Elasticomyces elasticus]|nr:hypothetical protein LTR27_012360 [Elasticomyces elasticus]
MKSSMPPPARPPAAQQQARPSAGQPAPVHASQAQPSARFDSSLFPLNGTGAQRNVSIARLQARVAAFWFEEVLPGTASGADVNSLLDLVRNRDARYFEAAQAVFPTLRTLTTENHEPSFNSESNKITEHVHEATAALRPHPYQGMHTNPRIGNYVRASFRKVESTVNVLMAQSHPQRKEAIKRLVEDMHDVWDVALTGKQLSRRQPRVPPGTGQQGQASSEIPGSKSGLGGSGDSSDPGLSSGGHVPGRPGGVLGNHGFVIDPAAQAQSLTAPTETGARNGVNVCYQNTANVSLIYSLPFVHNLKRVVMKTEFTQTYKELLIHLRQREINKASDALQLVWKGIDELAVADGKVSKWDANQHAGTWRRGTLKQQDAAEYITAFLGRNDIFEDLIKQTFSHVRGTILHCQNCDTSRELKKEEELIVYLPAISEVKDLMLLYARQIYPWEDLEAASDGNLNKGCTTAKCEAKPKGTSHRSTSFIRADPKRRTESIMIYLNRFDHDYRGNAVKDTSRIKVPEGFFFLPGFAEIFYASSFLDHRGGISQRGFFTSGHWLAYGRRLLSGGILESFTEWNDDRRYENIPFEHVNTGDNAVIVLTRRPDPKVSLPLGPVQALREALAKCSPNAGSDCRRALEALEGDIKVAIESVLIDYATQSTLREQVKVWMDPFGHSQDGPELRSLPVEWYETNAAREARREFRALMELDNVNFDDFVQGYWGPVWAGIDESNSPRHIPELWQLWLATINESLNNGLSDAALRDLRARRAARRKRSSTTQPFTDAQTEGSQSQSQNQGPSQNQSQRSPTVGAASDSRSPSYSPTSFNRVFSPLGMPDNQRDQGLVTTRPVEEFRETVPGLLAGPRLWDGSTLDKARVTLMAPSGLRETLPGAVTGAELRRMQNARQEGPVVPARAGPRRPSEMETSTEFLASLPPLPSTPTPFTFQDPSYLSYPPGGGPRGSSLGSQDVSSVGRPPGNTQSPHGDVSERSQLLEQRLGAMRQDHGLEPSASPSRPLESPRVVSLRGTPRASSAQHTSPTLGMPTRTSGRAVSQPSATRRSGRSAQDSTGSPAPRR